MSDSAAGRSITKTDVFKRGLNSIVGATGATEKYACSDFVY